MAQRGRVEVRQLAEESLGCCRRVVAATLLAEFIARTALANPGDLDLTFGVGGKAVANLGRVVRAAALQADGKILVAGTVDSPSPQHPLQLARFMPDGTRDDTFGVGGMVIDTLGASGSYLVDPSDIAVQSPTKLLVPIRDRGVFRYESDGGRDVAFPDWQCFNMNEVKLIVHQDGSFLKLGQKTEGNHNVAALARCDAEGVPDASFGVGGLAEVDFGAFGRAVAGIEEADGSLVVAAFMGSGQTALFRLTPEGTLDGSFGSGGTVLTGISAIPTSLIVQGASRLVVAVNLGSSAILAGYSLSGLIDPSFGDGGVAVIDLGAPTHANRLLGQVDGSLLWGGSAPLSTGTWFALGRRSADGSADLGFGIDGRVITPIGSSDEIVALLQQPDGKVVAVGNNLARYEVQTTTTTTTTATTSTTVTSTTLPEDGYVPPDPATARCENAIVRNLSKLVASIFKCHQKQASAAVAALPFDEEACEARARHLYDAANSTTLARGGCPVCMVTAVQDIGLQAESMLDALNGRAYCAGTVGME